MRAIRLLVPVLAVLLSAPAADAKGPIGCVVVTDAVGDTEVVAGSARTAADDAHVDIRGASVYVAEGHLSVRVYLDDLVAERRGTWRVTFVTRGKEAFVEGGTGAWTDTGSAWRAGLVGHGTTPGAGHVDYHLDAVTISAPVAAFGLAAPRPRDVLTRFAATATERLAHAGPPVELTDSAASTARYVAGRHCNDRFP